MRRTVAVVEASDEIPVAAVEDRAPTKATPMFPRRTRGSRDTTMPCSTCLRRRRKSSGMRSSGSFPTASDSAALKGNEPSPLSTLDLLLTRDRHALAVKRLLQSRYIPEITKITNVDGQAVDPPKPVPWYPDNLAWWMTTPKNVIRKFPPFAAFQKFLVSETSVGNISRQEVVSMIPPLLIDVRPGMVVLDLCAAPGSKAAQLLEMVHRGEEARMHKVISSFSENGYGVKTEEAEDEAARLEADPTDDGRATGLLIANDSDYKRSHMLIHQLKRLSSPNMVVTNHDATMFPSIKIPNLEDPSKNNYLKFDRILADVPCSGDGTLRKNVNLWKDWNPGNALGLHVTQVRILVRAMQMLKVGGRVVYSTCSMNPIENEAVVAAAIERCRGPEYIEILDCADQLPLLKRRDGLKKWQVVDKTGRMWDTWAEVEEFAKTTEDGVAPSRLVDTMFPRPEGSDCADLPLDRCMRVYGHLQDTGGFFITVLEKKAEFKAKPEDARKVPNTANGAKRPREEDAVASEDAKRQKVSEVDGSSETPTAGAAEVQEKKDDQKTEPEPVPEPISEPVTEPASEVDAAMTGVSDSAAATPSTAQTPNSGAPQIERKRKQEGPYEEPFKYISSDNDVIKDVTKFYNISPRFPTDRYLVRNMLGTPAKSIYYTSALIRDVLVLNEGRGVKFIHAGVKMFVKQDSPSAEVCRWRIQSEGMPILHGYVGPERVVVLREKETFRKLLVEMFPKISDGLWSNLGEVGERVRDVGMGCCVLRVEPDGTDPDFNERMALPLWKSFQSLNLMLPKEDRSAMLLRIFNDTTPLVNISLKKKSEQDAKAGEAEADEVKAGEGEEPAAEEAGAVEPTPEIKAEDTYVDPQVAEDAPSEED